MSATNIATSGRVSQGGESSKSKFVRKFKEQPLVPIGAAATTVALVFAMVSMRRGKSQTMNYWLRARVVAQGLTIAAIVGGSYALGQTKQQKAAQAAAAAEQDALIERAAFEARMRAAEEAHRLETAGAAQTGGGNGRRGGSWWGWLRGSSASKEEAPPAPVVEPPKMPVVKAVETIAAATGQATPPSKDKDIWYRIGWSSSEKKS